MSDLPPKTCNLGYTSEQASEILGDRFGEFNAWMTGQTIAICEGIDGCGPHGFVVYGHDIKRFLAGGSILD